MADEDALKPAPVPAEVCGEGKLLGAAPFEQVLGDLVVGVARADEVVKDVAVHVAGLDAAAVLDVRGEACCSVKRSVAEWAGDAIVHVGARLEVLFWSVSRGARKT